MDTRYLRTKEAAEYLGLSCSTLAKMRVYGTGPRFSKAGGAVIYSVQDLDSFVGEHSRQSTSEPTTK
jgi:hypothetical protein